MQLAELEPERTGDELGFVQQCTRAIDFGLQFQQTARGVGELLRLPDRLRRASGLGGPQRILLSPAAVACLLI